MQMISQTLGVLQSNYKPIWYNISETKPATVNTQVTNKILTQITFMYILDSDTVHWTAFRPNYHATVQIVNPFIHLFFAVLLVDTYDTRQTHDCQLRYSFSVN